MRRAIALIVPAFLALLMGGLLFATSAGKVTPSTPLAAGKQPTSTNIEKPTPTQTKPCIPSAKPPHFYAADRGKESPDAFGPIGLRGNQNSVIDPDRIQATSRELVNRLCGTMWFGGDRCLFVAIQAALGGSPNCSITWSAWARGVDTLVNQQIDWRRTRLVTGRAIPGQASMVMLTRGNNSPLIRGVRVHTGQPGHYLELFVHWKGKTVLVVLRTECGFQPQFPRSGLLPPTLR